MDPDILSAENYYNGAFNGSNSIEDQSNNNQWLGGLLANRAVNRKSAKKSGSTATNNRQPPKKENSKSTSADDSTGVRQRGRPRLDTRDQTAAEVTITPNTQMIKLES